MPWVRFLLMFAHFTSHDVIIRPMTIFYVKNVARRHFTSHDIIIRHNTSQHVTLRHTTSLTGCRNECCMGEAPLALMCWDLCEFGLMITQCKESRGVFHCVLHHPQFYHSGTGCELLFQQSLYALKGNMNKISFSLLCECVEIELYVYYEQLSTEQWKILTRKSNFTISFHALKFWIHNLRLKIQLNQKSKAISV